MFGGNLVENNLLKIVDRVAQRIKPLNNLVSKVVAAVAPNQAASACTFVNNYSQVYQYSTCWASTSCGSNKCVKWYNRTYYYSNGTSCTTLYGQCDSRTCSSASQCG